MDYEVSKFGNGVLTGSGGNVVQNVHNRFNGTELGEQAGVFETDGGDYQVSFTLTGKQVGRDATSGDAFLVPIVIPAGAVIRNVYATVTEAFVLDGTTPAIEVGTDGSEATNGFTITEAQAEATGTYDLTSALSGTWASPIASDITVNLALSGTTPTVTSAGSVDILIEYLKA